MQGRDISKKWIGFGAGAALATALIYLVLLSAASSVRDDASVPVGSLSGSLTKEMISAQLGARIKQGEFPVQAELEVDGVRKKTTVEYGLAPEAQAQMEKLFESYKPDYGAFVALDARTGRIISMVSYSRENDGLDNLALRATFPAASIFKVVTASAALGGNKATPDTIVPFNGANHTLYKRNVEDTKVNRWTRRMTMRDAFARSVNVVFSKLGLFYVGAENLLEYAQRYGFNRAIRSDVPMQPGMVKIEAQDPWSVATTASGFTRDSTMSPLQGALIAASVANDGVMMEPYLVERIQGEGGLPLYQVEQRESSITLSPDAAAELRVLMRETVKNGTSRKAFRQALHRRIFEDVEFGGKTGSLTGLSPAGKCDWFVGYARYRGGRIAVAALTVNEKKWRVKSSALASEFLSGYLRGELAREQVAAYVRQPAAARPR